MKTALSLSFLLMSTESSFLRSGRIDIVNILKLGTVERGLPWTVMVLRSCRCLSFSSQARSARKLQWRQRVLSCGKSSKLQSRLTRQLCEMSIHCRLEQFSIRPERTLWSPDSYLILLQPSMSDTHTNFTCMHFFFFFSSSSLALREIFFMAEELTMVETTELRLFWGTNLIIQFFLLSSR